MKAHCRPMDLSGHPETAGAARDRTLLPRAGSTVFPLAGRHDEERESIWDLLARDISVIDFRNPRRPVLRLTEGAVSAMTDAYLTETKDTLR